MQCQKTTGVHQRCSNPSPLCTHKVILILTSSKCSTLGPKSSSFGGQLNHVPGVPQCYIKGCPGKCDFLWHPRGTERSTHWVDEFMQIQDPAHRAMVCTAHKSWSLYKDMLLGYESDYCCNDYCECVRKRQVNSTDAVICWHAVVMNKIIRLTYMGNPMKEIQRN